MKCATEVSALCNPVICQQGSLFCKLGSNSRALDFAPTGLALLHSVVLRLAVLVDHFRERVQMFHPRIVSEIASDASLLVADIIVDFIIGILNIVAIGFQQSRGRLLYFAELAMQCADEV